MVVLIDERLGDGSTVSGTWLYDAGADRWHRVAGAEIPFALGMNYNMQYDPNHDLIVLVANLQSEPTAVWALRL